MHSPPDLGDNDPMRRMAQHKRMIARLFASVGKNIHVEFTNPNIGLFAQMNFCLNMAYYAETTGRRVYITLSSQNYRDPGHDRNWLNLLFNQRHCDGQHAMGQDEVIPIFDCYELPYDTDHLDLRSAHDLFFRHFSVKAEIAATVAAEAGRMGIGDTTLGVHYRGTDKHSEAEPVPRPVALAKIRAALAANPSFTNVFVASDDATFVRLIQTDLSDVMVCSLDDALRSQDETPVHLSGLRPGNSAIARDAVLNCLMLARCKMLVRTTSFLSAWASIFNPDLSVAMLNVPQPECRWFPETRVLEIATML